LSSRLLFVALLVATAGIMSLIYTWKLDQAQPYLNQDEAGFGINVYLLSTTRHDYFGNQLPIYIGYLDNHQLGGAFQAYWAIPFVRALGLSVFSIRLSVALIGLLALVLFAFLAWRLSGSRWICLLGVWVLGATPLFFMLSRVFLDGVVTVPLSHFINGFYVPPN
jgi:hypothetical protein